MAVRLKPLPHIPSQQAVHQIHQVPNFDHQPVHQVVQQDADYRPYQYKPQLISRLAASTFKGTIGLLRLSEDVDKKTTSNMKTSSNMRTTYNMKKTSNMKTALSMNTISNMKTTSNMMTT